MTSAIQYRPGWLLPSNILFILVILLLPQYSAAQLHITKKYETKASKILESHYSSAIPDQQLLFKSSDGLFHYRSLRNDKKKRGTLIFASSLGKSSYFDYLVLLDEEDKVMEVKVLRYRSDYGYQITSSRWLTQFKGYDGEEPLIPGRDVDALSGATISSRSITRDIQRIVLTAKDLYRQQDEDTE